MPHQGLYIQTPYNAPVAPAAQPAFQDPPLAKNAEALTKTLLNVFLCRWWTTTRTPETLVPCPRRTRTWELDWWEPQRVGM